MEEQSAPAWKQQLKDESKIEPCKEDADSGLDNNSDSGSSWEEEPPRICWSEWERNFNGPVPPETTKKAESKEENVGISRDVYLLTIERGESFCEASTNEEEISLETVPDFFRQLADGQTETVDFISTVRSKPDWLDEEKFKRGQKFAASNLFGLNFAEMLSLLMLFAPNSVLKPLIFTGKSDTPFKAFRRYLNTVTKLKSWYETDIWGEEETDGKKNIIVVNKMHKNVFTNLMQLTTEEVEKRTTLGDARTTALWCPMRDVIVEDFRMSCPAAKYHPNTEKKVWLSQLEMSITQFGFVGLAVTYPEYFGLHFASERDLDDFCHLWRGLGYLLGIKDKYNFCNGDLETVRQRTRDFIEMAVKPSFRDVTEEWEHMSRCMIRGIAFYVPVVEFEPALLYLCHTIGVEMPRLKKAMTYRHYFKFGLHRFVNFIQRFPGVSDRLNKRLHEFIRKAQEAPPEVLAQWEAMQFPYMNQPGKSQIRN